MLYNTLHSRWLRLVVALCGELISALGINLFIVPLGLYSGGTLGVCQLIRTLMQTYLHLDFGTFDIAGVLYSSPTSRSSILPIGCWAGAWPCGPSCVRAAIPCSTA